MKMTTRKKSGGLGNEVSPQREGKMQCFFEQGKKKDWHVLPESLGRGNEEKACTGVD